TSRHPRGAMLKKLIWTGVTEDRDELYRLFDLQRAFDLSYKEWCEFKNFLSIRQIFFEAGIFEGFKTLRDELSHVLTLVQVHVMQGQMPNMTIRTEIQQRLRVSLNARIDGFGAVIRARFGFSGLATPTGKE
ncbi:MAG: hypothetical protein AABO58_25920, partial [Acidobacteriota bacterium]